MGVIMKLFVQCLFLLTLWQGNGYAHDLWLEDNSAGQSVLNYGHSAVGHGGEKSIPYAPASVLWAQCLDGQGMLSKAQLLMQYPVLITSQCDAVFVNFSTGFWSKTPQGTVNKAKNEVGASYDSWLSQESLKRLLVWQDKMRAPLSQELELVANENPLVLGVGDKVRLTVYDHGKPAPNLAVAYFGVLRGTTDEQGQINIRIQQAGLQLFQTSKTEPYQDSSRANNWTRSATLQLWIR
jgi:nickel transport protein